MKGGKKMPYIITTIIYPNDIATEVAKMYLEAVSKFPPDENLATRLVPSAVKSTPQGIQVMVISEVKKGKLEEALNYGGRSMAMFNNFKGLKYSMDVYMKIEEAMETIGMSLPK
jgi:hypothetical protein